MNKTKSHIARIILAIFVTIVVSISLAADNRPNVLLLVADDLSLDSLGFAGGVAPDISPNIDKLASQSFKFEQAFTVVSVCQPSRQSMLSGLLPHSYGSGGFFPMKDGTATLPSMLKKAGYLTGNIHKLHHMLPEEAFDWDYDNERLGLTDPDGIVGRDPVAISTGLRRLIKAADKEGKPFFMVANSADPHRPFHGDPIRSGDFFWGYGNVKVPEPSRIYKPDEVVVPPTLPDLPGIRTDLAKYASSVRRLDDTVGACLKVLDDMGKESSTLVIFVSDNGMPLPFAKFDCYLGSNHSPLLMRWPEKIPVAGVNQDSLVSLMDITPTVLELAGLCIPDGLDGQSLVPFLENEQPDEWRESIVFLRNEDIYYGDGIRRNLERDPDFRSVIEARGWRYRPDHPSEGTYSREKEMRCYYDGRFGYIYNNWYRPDGLEYSPLGAGVPYGDSSFNAMKNAAAKNPLVKERYEFYLLRENEELYDWSADPGSQNNLARDPIYTDKLAAARQGLLEWMKSTDDPLLDAYRNYLNE